MRINLWANRNTLEIQVSGVKLKKKGTPINDAIVTATIKTLPELTDVTGITQPIVIPYETDTNGDYYVEIPHESNIEAEVEYRVNILVVSGSREWECEMDILAKKRPFPV